VFHAAADEIIALGALRVRRADDIVQLLDGLSQAGTDASATKPLPWRIIA
jgi:hypothetical protein